MAVPSIPPAAPVPPRETIGAKLRRAIAAAPLYPPSVQAAGYTVAAGTVVGGSPAGGYASAKQIATGVQILATDPRLLIGGGQLSPYTNGYVVYNGYEAAATPFYSQYHSYLEFVFDGPVDGKVEICTSANGNKIDVYVNDQLVQAQGSYVNKTGGNFVTHLLSLGTGIAGARIRVEASGEGYFGVGTDPRNTVSRVSTVGRVNLVNYGDSWIGPVPGGTSKQIGNGPVMAKAFGFRDDNHIGVGGTGLLNNNANTRSTWIQRAPFDLWPLLAKADILVINGSTNDGSFGAAVGPAAATFLQAIRAQGYKGPIVWAGIQGSTSGYPTAAETALAAAVQAQGAIDGATWFVDPYGWLTGTGGDTNLKGDGNQDFYNNAAQGHPNDAGNRYFGLRSAREVGSVIKAIP